MGMNNGSGGYAQPGAIQGGPSQGQRKQVGMAGPGGPAAQGGSWQGQGGGPTRGQGREGHGTQRGAQDRGSAPQAQGGAQANPQPQGAGLQQAGGISMTPVQGQMNSGVTVQGGPEAQGQRSALPPSTGGPAANPGVSMAAPDNGGGMNYTLPDSGAQTGMKTQNPSIGAPQGNSNPFAGYDSYKQGGAVNGYRQPGAPQSGGQGFSI